MKIKGEKKVKKILDLIADEMKSAFTACGYDASYAKVVLSNRPDLCEYQCNGAMAAAKAYKKKPIDIASEVVEKLNGDGMFSEINAVMPGFINIRLDAAYLADFMNGMAKEEKLGVEEEGHGETIIVDYGGANVAKPLHVGHLRSAVIGESVKRMGRYLGYNMIGDVHLGDWGLQMGLIIEELRDRKPDLVYFDENYTGEYPSEPPFTISELEDIYPTASGKSKVDEAFKERAQTATFKLQKGYPPYTAIWKHIMSVSLADLKRNYDNLDVHFELWKGESDAEEYIPWLIQDLQDKGLAYESQGALVVDVTEPTDSKELPPCIVRKSDGAALYATSDLGTIIQREKDFQPVKYVYITDKRQELHFKQVFRVAKKAGYVKPETPMIHIGFGTMNGKDGKPFKTRDGGVLRLEQLLSDVESEVREKMADRDMDEDVLNDAAAKIGLAAIKYGDLSNQASKDYVFDVDRFTSFEGNTGPYILYTIVRTKSLNAKIEAQGINVDGDARILPAQNKTVTDVMLALSKWSDTVSAAYQEQAPHKICQFVYELCDAYNKFYHENKILANEDVQERQSWIVLSRLVGSVLEQAIDLLGLEAPDRM